MPVSYITVTDVRNEGLTDTQVYPDQRIKDKIAEWQAFVDKRCRMWFEPRVKTIIMDGTDSDTLLLSIPIINIDKLFMNSEFEEAQKVPPDQYQVYCGEEDRGNPRIKIISYRRDIYRPSYTESYRNKFLFGRQNQKLVGTFGYVDWVLNDDGTPKLDSNGNQTYMTPPGIQRVMLKLVISDLDKLAPDGAPVAKPRIGPIVSESTDGHSASFALPSALKVSAPTIAITKDIEVEQILNTFRPPIAIKVPMSFLNDAG